MTAGFVLRLDHDFNRGVNEGGFHEVVLAAFMERNVHSGDVVDIADGELTVRGRVRCLVAVIEEEREPDLGPFGDSGAAVSPV